MLADFAITFGTLALSVQMYTPWLKFLLA